MAAPGVTVNEQQRVFVIRCGGGGFSCFGFDNCFGHCEQLAGLLGVPDLAPRPEEIGTLAQYDLYLTLIALASTRELGTYFDPGTPPAVRRALEEARVHRSTVRLFQGDRETGRSWLEENDVIGRIGRSTGILKVPLLVSAGADGGGAILTACVVRILDVHSRRELYRHPTFHVPPMEVRGAEVLVGGAVHARFPTAKLARDWKGFMHGELMRA